MFHAPGREGGDGPKYGRRRREGEAMVFGQRAREPSTITLAHYARKKRICESEKLLGEGSKEESFTTFRFRHAWWRFCLGWFAQRLFRKPVSEPQHLPKTVQPRVPRTLRRPDWKDKLWPGLV